MRAPEFLLAGLAAGIMTAARADETAPQRFDLGAYQSYVANWTPDTKPFCAILRSSADWSAVIRPAAVMGSAKPFAPPADTWTTNAVLVVARTAYASQGDAAALIVAGVRETQGAIEVETRFSPPPPSSYASKQAVALAFRKPLPENIVVRENGAVVCTLRPGQGRWRSVGR